MNKVCLITLGCPKNIVEGENIAGILRGQGWELTTDIRAATSAIVHTCSFIADASEESSKTIKSLARLKKHGNLKKIIVSGCMVQKEGEKIESLFPFADGFIGTGNLERISELLGDGRKFISAPAGGLTESLYPRLLSSSLPSAYLRISEGCNHRCSFCVIPGLRGAYRSRTMESIIREADELSACGVREIVLIAQDTTCYGLDLYKRFALPELLRKLAILSKIKWIRLLYAHPSGITDELLDTILSEKKICRYIDIPLQHVSERILKLMGRPPMARLAIERIKERIPGLSLRTTFIVGFPGETQKDFKELLSFVSEGWFDQAGAFAYSAEKGVKAFNMPGRVASTIMKSRIKKLMTAQKKVVEYKNELRIGDTEEVLVESLSGRNDLLKGRTRFHAPEVDSSILIKGKASPGSFIKAKITGYKGYDLLGEIK